MKQISIVILMLINISVLSQKEIQFGVNNFGANRILNFKDSNLDALTQETISDLEIFKYGISTSFTVQKKIDKYWLIRTGFEYRYTGWQSKKYNDFTTDYWNSVPSSSLKKDYYHIHQAILPIDFHCRCFNQKERYLLGGLRLIYTPHFASQRNFYSSRGGGKIVSYESNQFEDFPKWNISFRLGWGLSKSLNRKFDLWLEPYIEYYLLDYDTVFAEIIQSAEELGAYTDLTTTNSYLSIRREGIKGYLYQIGIHTYIQINK